MSNIFVSSAPHITKKGHTTRNIMLDVIIALIPACLASILIFGHLVAINLFFCILFSASFELLYSLIVSKKWNKEGVKNSSVWDLSSIVTGILIALNIPTYINVFGDGSTLSKATFATGSGIVVFSFDTVFACFLACALAIIVVKMLFGGIGKNFANPAMTARIFLFLCFSALAFSNVSTFISKADFAVTGATPLSPLFDGDVLVVQETNLLHMLLGTVGSAAVGETCIIAILMGYVYLCVRRVIDFRLPLMVIGSAFVFALLFKGLPDLADGAKFADVCKYLAIQVMSGGLIFGAVFMATDYSTSPNTFLGSVIFAVGIGLFTMLIRVFGAYPEGFSFALVIMNILVPIIDKYVRPRPFGFVKASKGEKPAKNPKDAQIEAKNVSVGGK